MPSLGKLIFIERLTASKRNIFFYHINHAHTFLILLISDPELAFTILYHSYCYYLFVQLSALQFSSLIHYVVFLLKSLSNFGYQSIKNKSVSKHYEKTWIKHNKKYIRTTCTLQHILSPQSLKIPYTTPRASTKQREHGFSIHQAITLQNF